MIYYKLVTQDVWKAIAKIKLMENKRENRKENHLKKNETEK